jgi:hypothetical protein
MPTAHVMHMCYLSAMASATQTAPTRTVVLLRPEERKKLEKLAAADGVSSGEIIRRSLRSYQKPTSPTEEEVAAVLLAQINTALDEMIVSLRSANSVVRENLDKIDAMQQAQIQEWEFRHK